MYSEPSVSVTGWSVACYNLEEWTKLTESFAGIRLKDVKGLYNNLSELLPHIEYLSQVKEREDKKKLLAALPRRTSDRIAVKAAEKEELVGCYLIVIIVSVNMALFVVSTVNMALFIVSICLFLGEAYGTGP